MLDRVTTVDLVAKAIDRVFSCDGRINGKLIYLPDELIKIGESMARRAADPARFTCQGFHTTSVIQSKMRQLLETDSVNVLLPIAELVTTGRASLKSIDNSNITEVEVDLESIPLDLEARLCDEQSITRKGFRDAAGQLYDLIVMQALLNSRNDPVHTYTFRQRHSINVQTTGEVLLKGFRELAGRYDTISEGSSISIADAFQISMLTEGSGAGLIVDRSMVQEIENYEAKFNPIGSAKELVERARDYYTKTLRPAQILVHINSLLEPELQSSGHDFHMISGQYDENSELFFCQSHWGQLCDSKLNGIDMDTLYRAMIFSQRRGGQPESYDQLSASARFVDTVYPVKPRDWASQLFNLKKENVWLEELENRSFETERGKALKLYREEYRTWQESRAQHLELLGEAIPFDKPEPERP